MSQKPVPAPVPAPAPVPVPKPEHKHHHKHHRHHRHHDHDYGHDAYYDGSYDQWEKEDHKVGDASGGVRPLIRWRHGLTNHVEIQMQRKGKGKDDSYNADNHTYADKWEKDDKVSAK